MTRAAVLISRQSKTPVGSDPWVRGALAAVEYAVGQGWSIVSSVGLNTWELVTWATGYFGGSVDLILPEQPPHHDMVRARGNILAQFGLDAGRIEWHVAGAATPGRRKAWWDRRDQSAFQLADVLLPVSIRPGGRLEAALLALGGGKTVDGRFRVAYDPQPHHETVLVDRQKLNLSLADWKDDYITHWTRACHGPWPGEKAADFYGDLVKSENTYCRSGVQTLRRMLAERRIRASSWRVGGGDAMVAFTALSPTESLDLMRWRPRWSRWSFEPYGIALGRNWAEAHGIHPVKYVTETEWSTLPAAEKPYSHRRGRTADVWPAEREWRCRGDLDLSAVPPAAMGIIVRDDCERAGVESLTEAPVTAFQLP